MAGEVFRTDVEVFTFDIDVADHVSNIVYLRWLEMTRVRFLDAVGLPIDEMIASGIAPVIARTEIDYVRPVRLREQVHVALWLSRLRAASAELRFEVTVGDEGEVAARADQLGLFVRLVTGRPVRMPADARARFEPYVRTDE
jgi:acyl-CoA thioester hydrolase